MKTNLTSIEEKYKNEDNQFLLDIAFATDDDYQPEVIAIAKKELTSRGVDIGASDVIELASIKKETIHKLISSKQNAELAFYLKAVCFLDTLILTLLVVICQSSSGKTRASKDAIRWWGYGWAFKIAVAILVSFNRF